MTPKRVVLLAVIGVLAAVGIFIAWHFATTKYPTHSDVFWYGAMAGFLATMLLGCLSLIGYLSYMLRQKA